MREKRVMQNYLFGTGKKAELTNMIEEEGKPIPGTAIVCEVVIIF